MARWEKAWAEVEALPVPAVEVEQKPPVVGRSVDLVTWFRVGAEATRGFVNPILLFPPTRPSGSRVP